MKRITTLATLAVTTAVTLSPMLAFADTSATADAHVDVNTKHSLFGGLGFGAHASSTAGMKHDGEDKGEKADKAPKDHMEGKGQDKGAKMMEHGNAALDHRVSMLQKFEDRIGAMKRLSADEKNSLSAEISAQITALGDLKAKLGTDTSTSTLMADIKSIRPDYRTFLLVLPKAALTAAADRVMTISTNMETIGAKLDARISEAQTAGHDVTASHAAYADYTSKVADAKVQAQAVLTLVADLKVDGGDAATLSANTAALKSARTKLQAARADLVAARKDITTILQQLKGYGVSVHASSTAETH